MIFKGIKIKVEIENGLPMAEARFCGAKYEKSVSKKYRTSFAVCKNTRPGISAAYRAKITLLKRKTYR